MGAIAEFFRGDNEPCITDHASYAITARGAIRLNVPDMAQVIHYNTDHGKSTTVAICLPGSACKMNRRNTFTEIGADADALRAEDRAGVLFDLGLGSHYFDFYVRVADRSDITRLRRAQGTPLFSDPHLLHDLAAMHPQRVFVSRVGRIEVFQPIAEHGGRTPDGPHTHLLPDLLATGRVYDEHAPIPPDWIPCVSLYPGAPPAH